MATVEKLEPSAVVELGERLATNIRSVLKVRDDVLRDLLVALLADGHVLIEDVPGVGKTALARALARSVDAEYARVQCTADLLPADVIGTNVFNQREARFEFHPGPVFANVVLVDEINRASPKTQSGLLECMQERRVTVDRTSHQLAQPFLVIATQNPIEYEGTYPLPRGAARPLHVPALARLPGGRGGGGDARRPRGARPRARPRAGRRRRDRARRPGHRLGFARQPGAEAPTWSPSARRRVAIPGWSWARAHGRRCCSSGRRRRSPRWQGRDHALPDDVQALAPMTLSHRLVLAPGVPDGERQAVIEDALKQTPAL